VKLARPGAAAAPVTLTYPDGSNETLQVTPEGVQLDRKLTFPSGDSAVAIHVDGPGVSSGYVKLIGWRITPS
jgi:hypothetical protein